MLITGASGGVGTLAAQRAKTFRAQITSVCNTMEEDLVRSIGAADACQRTGDTAKSQRVNERHDHQRPRPQAGV